MWRGCACQDAGHHVENPGHLSPWLSDAEFAATGLLALTQVTYGSAEDARQTILKISESFLARSVDFSSRISMRCLPAWRFGQEPLQHGSGGTATRHRKSFCAPARWTAMSIRRLQRQRWHAAALDRLCGACPVATYLRALRACDRPHRARHDYSHCHFSG